MIGRHLPALALAVLAACAGPRPGEAPRQHVLRDARSKMGAPFEIQLVATDEAAGRAAIDAAYDEIDRVEALISEWRESSEISEVNRRAGEAPVGVGPDLLAVLERSIWTSEVTEGAFDVTFAACGRAWSIRERRVATEAEISACLPHIGFRRIELDARRSTVFLPDPAMRIGVAGIGQGYGVDRAVEVLEARGFDSWVVDGAGDVRLSGTNVDRPWSVGIAHPRRRGELFAVVRPGRGAIVTSGDYERYFERDGVVYHHILDPATGRPARRSIAVTVIAPNATDADALSTGLFVLGPERGIEVAEALPGVEALIFGPDLEVRRTSGFPETLPPAP